MKKLVAFFVDRSLVVNLITVGVIVCGAIALSATPRALVPPQQKRYVEVYAELPGASALDMERFVTFRLEEALTGMEQVEQINSSTKNGVVHVRVKVKPDVMTLTPTMEEVRSRLSALRHLLPKDMRPLRIKEQKRTSAQWLLNVLVENVDKKDPKQRAAVASLAERLRRIPNVIAVRNTMPRLNLYVRFYRQKMQQARLDVTVARQRLQEFLGQMPVGAVRVRDQDVSVELKRPFLRLEDLKRLPLRVNRLGRGITLGEVASVRIDFAPEATRWRLNGQSDYVELAVVNSEESDSIDISKKVRGILAKEGKKLLPAPLRWRIGQDGSGLIEHELTTLTDNGIGGVVIVLVVLMLFLGWRISLMTAIGLPFAYMGIVLALHLFGLTFNLISLVAMILVIGILVDDAIIVSEEYCQRLAAGETGREAAIGAVARVAKPVLGMVATTTVAFLPVVVLKGGLSWLIKPLPIVIISALFISLFESFFLLPNHLKHIMPSGGGLKERRFVGWLQAGYRVSLRWTLKLRYLTVLLIFALVGLALLLVAKGAVRFSGNLQMNGSARVYVELKEPTRSLDALAAKVAPIEKVIASLPKKLCDHYVTRLGSAYQPGSWNEVQGWKYAEIELIPMGSFIEQEERRFIAARKLKAPIEKLAKDPSFKRLVIKELSSKETKDSVTVYVSGGDRIEFTEIQDAIRNTLTGTAGIKDIYMDQARFQRAYVFAADERKVLSYGLTKSRLQAQLREHFSRHELMRMRHKGEEIEVFLEFDDDKEPTLEGLSKLEVISGGGTSVALSYLGRWRKVEVLRRIEHRDLLRLFQIDVVYDRDDTDAKKVSKLIEGKLAPLRKTYPGYHISVKPSEEEAKAKSWMLQLVFICVGLIYLCLALALGSLSQPIVVILAIPFGFVGVVLAFYLHGMILGLMAIIGLMGLAGVVVNDSLVMASTINDCLRDDPDGGVKEAIIEGATRRLRAVVLTSLTTLGGVFPLAYGLAGHAGWIQPMVFAVGWGLLCATILSLYFIPSLLLIFNDFGRMGRWAWRLVFRKGA